MTLTFDLAIQFLHATWCLNIVNIYIKLFENVPTTDNYALDKHNPDWLTDACMHIYTPNCHCDIYVELSAKSLTKTYYLQLLLYSIKQVLFT
jgi:hypothetical protein